MLPKHREEHCPLRSGICDKARNFPSKGGLIKTKRVFVTYDTNMPEETDILRLIKECVLEEGFEPVTFKEGEGTQFWCANICPEIRRCAFMIAEISYWKEQQKQKQTENEGEIKKEEIKKEEKIKRPNPNVIMEVGMAVALGKPIISIKKEDDKVLPYLFILKKQMVSISKIPDPDIFKSKLRYEIRIIGEKEEKGISHVR